MPKPDITFLSIVHDQLPTVVIHKIKREQDAVDQRDKYPYGTSLGRVGITTHNKSRGATKEKQGGMLFRGFIEDQPKKKELTSGEH